MTGTDLAAPVGTRLEQLDRPHRDALLRFEQANRAWFARWGQDRGVAPETPETSDLVYEKVLG